MLLSVLVVVFLVLCCVGAVVRRSRREWSLLTGDVFRCRLRTCGFTSRIWPRLPRRWSRPMWAMWVDDALAVRRGPVFSRMISLPAAVSRAGVFALAPDDPPRSWEDPIAVRLMVADESLVEVAANAEARLDLVGPYLAAAINALPTRRSTGPGSDVAIGTPDDPSETEGR
jgi:hypothetical protein